MTRPPITRVAPVPGYYKVRVCGWIFPKAFTAFWGYGWNETIQKFINESVIIHSANWVDDLSDGYYDVGFASKTRAEAFLDLLENFR